MIRSCVTGSNAARCFEAGFGSEDNPVVDGMHEAAAFVAGGSLVAAESVHSGIAVHAFNPAGGLPGWCTTAWWPRRSTLGPRAVRRGTQRSFLPTAVRGPAAGDKAKAYADGFIGRRLEAVAGRKTSA